MRLVSRPRRDEREVPSAATIHAMNARTPGLTAVAAALMLGCGGQTTNDDALSSSAGASTNSSGAPSGSPAAAAAPTCSWSLPQYDFVARNEACTATRAYVECVVSDGSTRSALSEDPARSHYPIEPGLQSTCKNLCETATEYAVHCGSDGPSGLPPSCRSIGSAYGSPDSTKGTSFHCCPCQ